MRAELRRQGITPTVVKPKPKPLFGGAGKRITAEGNRGVQPPAGDDDEVGRADRDVAGDHRRRPEEPEDARNMVNAIRADIEGGSSLYEALGKHPVQFDELYRNLVKAGESAGVLETVLDTIATYKENIESLKGKIKKALFYPATVHCGRDPGQRDPADVRGAAVPAGVPELRRRPAGLHPDDHRRQRFHDRLLVAGAAASWSASIFAFICFKKRSLAFAHFLDRMMLKMPVVGQILHNVGDRPFRAHAWP